MLSSTSKTSRASGLLWMTSCSALKPPEWSNEIWGSTALLRNLWHIHLWTARPSCAWDQKVFNRKKGVSDHRWLDLPTFSQTVQTFFFIFLFRDPEVRLILKHDNDDDDKWYLACESKGKSGSCPDALQNMTSKMVHTWKAQSTAKRNTSKSPVRSAKQPKVIRERV